MNSYQILLFYTYTTIDDPKSLMERERAVWNVLGLRGRMIIAKEGINGTLEGTLEATEKYVQHIKSDKRFRAMDIKRSEGTGTAFPKASIKVRDEIVATHLPSYIQPQKKTAKYLPPHELKKMYDKDEDFVVIDMRNQYEIESGYFEKTVSPELQASRDLVSAIEKIGHLKDKKVVTVCTGGVRCEKMSAYLLDQGFKDVSQLHGGMHAYMEKYPGENFKGTLYTFDNRKVMDFGGEREIVGKCHFCIAPTEVYVDFTTEEGREVQILLCDACQKEYNSQIRG